MKVTNGEIKADLPDTLAKLLIDNLDWTKDRTGKTGETVTLADRVNALAAQPAEDNAPIPMTRVPGVVDISMNRLKKLVADGTIPHVLKDRTKLVKPSDVRALLDREATTQ
jgi:hypothetical protein